MKYYIPTTTLNFNNIMSSESVSPKAFYARRGFGYPRWEAIPENEEDNVVLLYEQPFKLTRPKSDKEDHPMLIEIETEEEFPKAGKGVRYSDHTIYLSQWRTRIIFFSEKDKLTTLSMSDSASEVKMRGLYERGFMVDAHIKGKVPKGGKVEVALNEAEMERDYKLNKLKGLLYGYYIGALLSSSPESVKEYNELRELEEIFSAVLSLGGHVVTPRQEKRLEELLGEIRKEEIREKWYPIVRSTGSSMVDYQVEKVIAAFEKAGAKFPFTDKERVLSYLKGESENNRAMNWLKQKQRELNRRMGKERQLLSSSADEIVLGEVRLNKISEKVLRNEDENLLMRVWVNEALLSKEYNGKVSVFKDDLATEIVTKARDEVYKERWEGCEAKALLNGMRRYVKGEETDFAWDNLLASSMAAVLAKGSEWDKLLDFMRSKGMADYRLAFAFYGELNGFAGLGRDFTDNLLGCEEGYVDGVYVEFMGQLLGKSALPPDAKREYMNFKIDLDTKCLPRPEEKTEDLSEEKVRESVQKSVGAVLGDKLTKESNIGEMSLQESQGTHIEDESQNVVVFTESSSNEKEKNQKWHVRKILEDRDWIGETEQLCPDKKVEHKTVKKQYVEDVDFFVANYQEWYVDKKKGKVQGRYRNYPKGNKDVIENLRGFLNRRKSPERENMKWTEKYYKYVPVDDIIIYLKERYHVD